MGQGGGSNTVRLNVFYPVISRNDFCGYRSAWLICVSNLIISGGVSLSS